MTIKQDEAISGRRVWIKKWLAAIAICALIAIATWGLGDYTLSRADEVFSSRRFDRELWLSGTVIRDATQCLPGAAMAEDIKATLVSNRMARRDVVELLGGPDTNEPKLSYSLGMCVGHKEQSLIIHFDDSGHVIDAEIK
jgi:hypothetical protein